MERKYINFIHLCDAATIDSAGKLNILGIFGKIFMLSLPGRYYRFAVVISINLEDLLPGKHKLNVTIQEPEKQELTLQQPILMEFEAPKYDLSEGKPVMNLLLEIGNLEFLHYGKHKLVIWLDNKEIGSEELMVEKPEKKL